MAESRLMMLAVTLLSLVLLTYRSAAAPGLPEGIVVEVVGEVSGFVSLAHGAVAADAVSALGGPLSAAAEPLHDGDRVRVLPGGHAHIERAHALLFGRRVDLNNADPQDLMTLPGIGAASAVRVLDERPFFRPADIERVHGLGPRAAQELAPLLAVADPVPPPVAAPIDLNTADAERLTRLPGIGPALAQRIVHSREALGPFASLDDLVRVHGIGPSTVLRLQTQAVAQ